MPRYYFSSVNLIVHYLVLPKVFFMAIGIDSIEQYILVQNQLKIIFLS